MNKEVVNIINDSQDFNYNLKDKKEVIINYYHKDQKDIKISLIQNNDSKLTLNFFCYINEDVKVYIDNIVTGNNNISNINVRAIACKNNGYFDVKIKALEKTKNNVLIEDIKGLNENGAIILKPVLEIDTKDIDAKHYATIGSFNFDELFYLANKGISFDEAKNIIKQSLVYGMFDNKFIKIIKDSKNE